jgi:hypothetical protein
MVMLLSPRYLPRAMDMVFSLIIDIQSVKSALLSFNRYRSSVPKIQLLVFQIFTLGWHFDIASHLTLRL